MKNKGKILFAIVASTVVLIAVFKISYQKNKLPCQESIKEFGDSAKVDSGTIVYGTYCSAKSNSPEQKDEKVHRVYVRGIDNEFSKKVFETKEDLMDLEVVGENEDIIYVETSNRYGENKKEYYFTKKGDVTVYDHEDQEKEGLYAENKTSPDNKYQARIHTKTEQEPYQPKPDAIIEIYNQENRKSQRFDLRDQVHPWEGIEIDSWSTDSRYVYITGGIYELAASAKLWRIDVEKMRIENYDLGDDDTGFYPVYIYPKHGIAFVVKKHACEDKISYKEPAIVESLDRSSQSELRLCDYGLYKIDLGSKEVSLLGTDKTMAASYGFANLIFTGKEIFYTVSNDFEDTVDSNGNRMLNNNREVRKISFLDKEPITYGQNESRINHYISSKNILIINKQAELFVVDLDTQEEGYLGKSTKGLNTVREEGQEYIGSVFSILE